MPGRREAAAIDAALCRRCQIREPLLTVRTELLCRDCFCKYVVTKVVKRMESFRVRHTDPGLERTLLLPLSLGAGSTTLLHVLSQHLKGQVEKTRRTGFKLLVLYVDDGTSSTDVSFLLERVKHRYPEHAYISSLLSDILSLEDVPALLWHVNANDSLTLDNASNSDRFEHLISSLDSATSRADAIEILKRRLIVNIAKEHDCEAILWGDSTTRLAERTLSETAKGRGFALPWIVSDGESPHGIQIYYPMRELLSKEIAAFASLQDPPLDDLICKDEVKPTVSTKNTTIDHLMTQYFESVEREYPSIVANVVRTAGKLQAMPLSEFEKQCELCEMPLDGQAPERRLFHALQDEFPHGSKCEIAQITCPGPLFEMLDNTVPTSTTAVGPRTKLRFGTNAGRKWYQYSRWRDVVRKPAQLLPTRTGIAVDPHGSDSFKTTPEAQASRRTTSSRRPAMAEYGSCGSMPSSIPDT